MCSGGAVCVCGCVCVCCCVGAAVQAADYKYLRYVMNCEAGTLAPILLQLEDQ